jgi:predicted transcriptional regulator
MVSSTTEAITLSLPADLRVELARIAHESSTTEVELARKAIERYVHVRTLPPPPRFARRLGPIVEE